MAGHKGAVTVATNMAGRGTDIMLGGSVEFLADQELRKRGLDPVEHAEEYEAAWPDTLHKIEEQVKAEHEEVTSLGGLAVIGTERHESRRIDNQLRGRSGRQGDPGASRFYLSLEDDLMRLFKSDWVDWILTTMKIPDDVPIENKRVTSSIASAQGQVESQNFETRKNILKYDDVMNRQREVIYAERRLVLEGEDLQDRVQTMISDVVEAYVTGATEGFPEEWDLDQLWTALKTLYPITLSLPEVEAEHGGRDGLSTDILIDLIIEDAQAAYARREDELGSEVMRELERRVVLSVLDRKWRENLYEMDYLREGIGLRAYSQRDPLVEYQREGFDMFNSMMDAIKEESVGYLFNVDVQIETQAPEPDTDLVELGPSEPGQDQPPQISARGMAPPSQPQQLSYSAPTVDGATGAEGAEVSTDEADDPYAHVGRNEPCPCGSGRKFKRCHGDPASRAARAQT
jgi:preprotein translocase subunit SecA